ncbi:MAG: GLPGLI family protein [Chitinophagaceae bacterium]|nr:GLPGLI family protein [Chitinophagaceae bacterium]
MNKTIILLFFFSFYNNINAQKSDTDIVVMRYDVFFKKNDTILLKDECNLYKSGDKSFFYSLNKLKYNEILNEKIEMAAKNGGRINFDANDGKMMTNFMPFNIIKDYKEDKSIFIEDVGDQTLGYIKDSSLKRNWDITEDTATINNLFCQKAIYKYKTTISTAWYSPSIPIMDGPFAYCNLPGLIVKVENNFGWYAVLTNIAYKKTKNSLEKIPKYLFMTEAQFQKIKKRNLDALIGNKAGEKITIQKVEN